MNYYNIIHCTIFDSINEFKVGLLSIYLKYIFLFLNKKNMYIFPFLFENGSIGEFYINCPKKRHQLYSL